MKRIAAMIILALLLIPSVAGAGKQKEAWVMCQPDSEVNVRAFPKKSAETVARLSPGDHIELSGRKKGRWYHCYVLCEAGEGWIRKDFITFSEPEIFPGGKTYVTTRGKLYARCSIGGRKRLTLRKNTDVIVYLISAEWAVTNKGYIMSEYLEEIPDDG